MHHEKHHEEHYEEHYEKYKSQCAACKSCHHAACNSPPDVSIDVH